MAIAITTHASIDCNECGLVGLDINVQSQQHFEAALREMQDRGWWVISDQLAAYCPAHVDRPGLIKRYLEERRP